MLYTQHFYIDNRFLGSAPRKPEWRQGCVLKPRSDLYFCPHCGNVWARLPVYDEHKVLQPWQAYSHGCAACSGESYWLEDWPGSIWRSLDHDFLQSLPVEVLRWEVIVLSNQLDRFPDENTIIDSIRQRRLHELGSAA